LTGPKRKAKAQCPNVTEVNFRKVTTDRISLRAGLRQPPQKRLAAPIYFVACASFATGSRTIPSVALLQLRELPSRAFNLAPPPKGHPLLTQIQRLYLLWLGFAVVEPLIRRNFERGADFAKVPGDARYFRLATGAASLSADRLSPCQGRNNRTRSLRGIS